LALVFGIGVGVVGILYGGFGGYYTEDSVAEVGGFGKEGRRRVLGFGVNMMV